MKNSIMITLQKCQHAFTGKGLALSQALQGSLQPSHTCDLCLFQDIAGKDQKDEAVPPWLSHSVGLSSASWKGTPVCTYLS